MDKSSEGVARIPRWILPSQRGGYALLAVAVLLCILNYARRSDYEEFVKREGLGFGFLVLALAPIIVLALIAHRRLLFRHAASPLPPARRPPVTPGDRPDRRDPSRRRGRVDRTALVEGQSAHPFALERRRRLPGDDRRLGNRDRFRSLGRRFRNGCRNGSDGMIGYAALAAH